MFYIPAGYFDLSVEPVRCQFDHENGRRHDWITVRMVATVPYIRAEMEWELMRGELYVFHEDLERMYASIQVERKPRPLKYVAMEGVLELDLQLVDIARGAILLTFAICPESATGIKLTGSAPIDQSFLPGMISGLRQLAAFE